MPPLTYTCIAKTVFGIAVLLSSISTHDAFAEPTQGDRFISRTRRLTFEGRRAGEGYFSPDGTKLILQSERYPGNPFFQIYTLDLETGRQRLISPGVGRTTCSYFRPGTDQVMFASTHLDPQAREKQRREYEDREDPSAERPVWVYDEYFDIFSCDRRGRGMQRLTDAWGYDAEGAYSPDGKLIVFGSLRDAYPLEDLDEEQREAWDKDPSYFGEIYIMNADGSDQRRLTDWPGYDGGPFFTADGERIIWRHFEPSGLIADIYTMKIDGSDRRRLTDFKSMSWAPYMHPSGEYAIFASNKLGFQNFELFLVDALGEKQPIRVTYTDGFDGLPVFAPKGDRLCWTSNRATMQSRKGQLFIADWDHAAALAAVRAAPLRGALQSEPPPISGKKTQWPQSGPPPVQKGYVAPIADDDLFQHVAYLASDELEGRMTGSEGAEKASEYIAERFREAGIEPLGDGDSYFQKFPFPAGIDVVPEKNGLTIRVEGEAKSPALELDRDYRPMSFTSNGSVDGPVVWAGYGLTIPEEPGKPGYESYEGLDVKGKIVLVLDDVPGDISMEDRIRYGHYASARYKAKQALKHGAAGMLMVIGPKTPGAGNLLQLARTDNDAGIAACSITIETAELLLRGSEHEIETLQGMLDDGEIPAAVRDVSLKSEVELETHLARREGHCRNVVGLLPPLGDARMSDEYVLVGAHYDHIGHGEAGGSRAVSGEEGQIHNGADDNASGVAVLLELAASLAEERNQAGDHMQQRGIIFAAWSGEEIGLVGSSYFATHAPCPLGQIAAYVNFDMVGRLRGGRLILQGAGSSPAWDRLIEKVNIRQPLAVVVQNDPYLPSDSTTFYPAGVPVLSFFTDVHDDYNRPTDDADRLNYAGMLHIARFGEFVLRELATQPEKPDYATVDRPSTPEGGMRGRRIYTGTIPDFAAGDAGGMKISGVQGGSPAEKAGLVGGDLIVELAGHEIGGLEDYAVILRALKPGEPVEIVVRRDEKELHLTITPTVRK